MPRGQALTAVLVGSALQIVLIPLAGAMSDRWNRPRLYLAASVAADVWPFALFPLAETRSWPLLVLGVIGALVIHSMLYGPQAAFVAEQFGLRLRYTGSSLAYTLAGLIGGAVAPLIFTALLGTFGTWLPLAGYIVLTAVLTVIGVLLGRDPDHGEDEEYTRQVSDSDDNRGGDNRGGDNDGNGLGNSDSDGDGEGPESQRGAAGYATKSR